MEILRDSFIEQEPEETRVFYKKGQAIIRFISNQDGTFSAGDCMEIKNKNKESAFFLIVGFRKILIDVDAPNGHAIYKILGRLYQDGKWRIQLSSIDYYSETKTTFFTHNNRSIKIDQYSIPIKDKQYFIVPQKKCPKIDDKPYNRTDLDTVGNEQNYNYSRDYKIIIPTPKQINRLTTFTVKDPNQSRVLEFNVGDCLCFNNSNSLYLTSTSYYVFKITKIQWNSTTTEFKITGRLLDKDNTCLENQLIWETSEITFYKKSSKHDTFSMKWNSPSRFEYIDWNTLDFELPQDLSYEDIEYKICDSLDLRDSYIRQSEYVIPTTNPDESKTLSVENNTVVIKSTFRGTEIGMVVFKKDDCIQIPYQNGTAYFKIVDIQKVKMNSVKGGYDVGTLKQLQPIQYSICKISGNLYTESGWRQELSTIKFYAETNILTFTHNYRTRQIPFMSDKKNCPESSHTPTELDTIGISENDSDYRELITEISGTSVVVYKGDTPDPGITFTAGDCLHFDQSKNFIGGLHNPYWYIFKITGIKKVLVGTNTKNINIIGHLLDFDKMDNQRPRDEMGNPLPRKLIWNETQLYFKGNSEDGFLVEWSDYKSRHFPTYIDWNTLDTTTLIPNDASQTENINRLIDIHVPDTTPIPKTEEELTAILDQKLQTYRPQTTGKITTRAEYDPVAKKDIVVVSNDYVHHEYRVGCIIKFKDHQFKIDDIKAASYQELTDNYICFIIYGKLNETSQLSSFYCINDKVFYVGDGPQLDWNTIDFTNRSAMCSSRGGTFKKRHKMNKSRKYF